MHAYVKAENMVLTISALRIFNFTREIRAWGSNRTLQVSIKMSLFGHENHQKCNKTLCCHLLAICELKRTRKRKKYNFATRQKWFFNCSRTWRSSRQIRVYSLIKSKNIT